MKIWKIVALIVVLAILADLFIGLYLSIKSNKICRENCKDALGIEIIKSGNMELDDLCICYYEDGIYYFNQNNLNEVYKTGKNG